MLAAEITAVNGSDSDSSDSDSDADGGVGGGGGGKKRRKKVRRMHSVHECRCFSPLLSFPHCKLF